MKSIKHSLLKGLSGLLCASAVFAANAQIIPTPPEINAKGYFLVDFTTGKVITEGEADTKLAPASLTKMMTSYVIGTEIAAGNISPTDMVTVSENAWAKNFPESSKMFIEVGKQVSVEDLNRGIIIQSGNDACVAMAEHIAGSESAFADLMNAHADKLGMTNTHFINSHGLDTDEHYTTPRDMATLGAALIRDVPDEYALYKEKDFTYNGIKQFNRNSLLWDQGLDVDGIKTGHTSEAGYSLVSSATKGDMRLIAVVMGTSSERARKVESKKLLNYGFRFFETVTPYKAGDKFADQRIWMGDKENVSLGILEDTPITIPRGQQKNLEANFELDTTLEAPLEKGTKVGTLYLRLAGEDIASYPLVTLESVQEGGFFSKIYDYLRLQIIE
ncbi:serine hydrolase [Pseudoalteromonas pernae]|uniref:serine hydrolase n=1 Tax=Pseudoalteromonas pernae TaxID=3118054 RepID=UPI003242E92C